MSREIKFRAWDKNKKQMLYQEQEDYKFSFYPGIPFVEITDEVMNCNDESYYSISGDDIPIMQFTGLHDKNGKEIYEGDILRAQIDDLDREDIYVVKFYDFTQHIGGGLSKGMKIVGNIYENPDLIK